ncbi:MAG TPA: hypothetical protein VIO14_11060 [Dehalococcoidia bacterium]
MAIDYVVNYPCDAKQVVGTVGLLEMLRARIAYGIARERARRGETGPFWVQVVRREDGEEVRESTEHDLRQRSNRLVEFTSGCGACPANVRGGPVGCYGRINYPIDAATEEFVAQRLAGADDRLRETPAALFFQWIAEGPVDGRGVRYLRASQLHGVRFFEREEPLAIQACGPGLGGLTTDHVFELLFFGFPIRQEGFAYTLPAVALPGHEAVLRHVLEGEGEAEPPDARTARQLAVYLRAVETARALEVDLLLD